jgi:hypothetical protein
MELIETMSMDRNINCDNLKYLLRQTMQYLCQESFNRDLPGRADEMAWIHCGEAENDIHAGAKKGKSNQTGATK